MAKEKNNKVVKELESIRKKHGGVLRPKDVVAFAENPKTELHRKFEWDDSEAAKKYRLEQARYLIRFTVTLVGEDPEPFQMYYSIQEDRPAGDSYRHIVDVMSDKELKAKMLSQAFREADAWSKRYSRFEELAGVFDAIAKAKKKGRKRS